MLLKRIRWWASPTERIFFFQLTSVVPFSLFWMSWPLEMVPIGSPNTLVRNYHSMNAEYLRRSEISHDNLVMQTMVWLWWSGSEQSGLGRCSTVISYANLRWPHILEELKEKTSSCIQVNMVNTNPLGIKVHQHWICMLHAPLKHSYTPISVHSVITHMTITVHANTTPDHLQWYNCGKHRILII